jgi:3-methyladenine DNA glycosylase AlkD
MIIRKLKQEIKKYDKPENKIDAQQFFKEKLKIRYVLKAPVARKISDQLYREYKHLSKKEIFGSCEELLEKGEGMGRMLAFEWAFKRRKEFVPADFKRFENWLKKYVEGWGACDHLCSKPLGEIIYQYPELIPKTEKWRGSKNRWMRRAAAVCLIKSVRRGQCLKEVFETADKLLTDDDDMVQKGYGWMLKDASNMFRDEVYDYVLKNKKEMPRTALRYAIEKLPEKMRREAMKKDW